MESFSLHELNEYIRRVVALNFQEPIWVHGEISQISESRGNYYLQIVEKKEGSEEVIAQSSAALWYKSYMFLKKKIGPGISSLLQDGIQVKLKINLDFHERYGLKMIIEDIDPNYTMGQVELNRQKIIKQLKDDGVYDLNNSLELPSVLQRVACIASERSAGYADFMKQLEHNGFDYDFEVSLYDSAVQGRNVEGDILGAFEDIKDKLDEYDCVIIIRGGGSKLDLSGFDNYNIASAIANCGIPVFTGIGHEIDETVSDMVAYKALKTPTAVASYIVDKCSYYEGVINELSELLRLDAAQRLKEEEAQLKMIQQEINLAPKSLLEKEKLGLETMIRRLERGFRAMVSKEDLFVTKAETLLEVMDPKHILKRGFTIIKQSGKIVSKAKQIDQRKNLKISFADADLEAKILQTKVK